MEQSVYTALSKKIGWDERSMLYPTLEEAKKLYEGVVGGDREAFYKVFEMHRHLHSPTDAAQVKIINLIFHAYTHGQDHWRNVEEPFSPSLEE